MENKTTDLQIVPKQSATELTVFSLEGFEHFQRIGMMLCQSKLVPTMYQGKANLANCLVAMELASRMQISPFLVMQQMELIHGRPAWRAKFKVGQINASGRFMPIRYEYKDEGKKVVEYATYYDPKGNKKYQKHKHTLPNDKWCRAVSKDMDGNECLGPWVSYSLAVSEGWWHRKGSKWPSMPEKMLMYRAGSWFADVFDPGSSMGLKTISEEQEIGKVEIVKNSKLDELNQSAKTPPIPNVEDAEIDNEPDVGAPPPNDEEYI